MICFLTSRHDIPGSFQMNPANGFMDRLRRCLSEPCRALFVCSDPDDWATMDYYAELMEGSFVKAGFPLERFGILDGRNADRAAELVGEAKLLILAGGHVPTQNRFFARIGLRELLRDFDGVLVGISAGSMNCAETVYAQPERDGEAADPNYRRFLPGLGLTKRMLLPHYQDLKNEVLDGLRVMEDVAFPDSMGRCFYCLPDGSYLLLEDGKETLFGEAWSLKDGKLTHISSNGTSVELLKDT